MFYYAIIFALILLLLNTFGISKIYKRFFKNTEIIRLYTFGLLSTIAVFCLPLIPIVLFSVNLWFLNYYFLVIQIILFIAYLINWRWFIITWRINYKKIIVFSLIFVSVFMGWIFSNNLNDFNNLKFVTDRNIIDFLYLATIKDSREIFLFQDQVNLINQPLIYNLFLSYLSLFKLDKEYIYYFVNIFSLSTYILFFSLSIMSVFYVNNSSNLFLKSFYLCICSFLASFFNMTLSFNFDSFIQFLMPLILLVIWLHYTKYNEMNSSLTTIFVNVISFMSLSINIFFIIPFTIINIMNLGLSYYTKKQKATDYNVFNLFLIIITWSLLIRKIEYLSIIVFTIVICFYIFYFFYRTSSFGMKLNNKIDRFLYKWIFMITCIIVFTIITSIIIYYSLNDDFTNIIDKWKIHKFFHIDINNTNWLFLTINITYWLINIFIFIYSVINFYFYRRRKESFGYMELSLISMIIFWNPLSLDLIEKLLNDNFFSITLSDTYYLNLFLIPLTAFFMSATKIYINNRHKNIYNVSYLTLLLATTIGCIVIINLW